MIAFLWRWISVFCHPGILVPRIIFLNFFFLLFVSIPVSPNSGFMFSHTSSALIYFPALSWNFNILSGGCLAKDLLKWSSVIPCNKAIMSTLSSESGTLKAYLVNRFMYSLKDSFFPCWRLMKDVELFSCTLSLTNWLMNVLLNSLKEPIEFGGKRLYQYSAILPLGFARTPDTWWHRSHAATTMHSRMF